MSDAWPLIGLLAVGPYLLAVRRLRRRGVRWPAARTLAFAAGVAAVVLAFLAPLAVDDERLDVHVGQHLLMGMLGPVLVALAAPVTLALRALPPARRPRVARALHVGPLRVLGYPPLAALLAVGPLPLLLLTPLSAATLRSPALHGLVHVHVLLAGCLFASTIVGLDPSPHRRALRLRTAALVAAMAVHAATAKLLYAHAVGLGEAAGRSGEADAWRRAGLLLWYGGDAVDLLLLVALFHGWYAAGGRGLGRTTTT